MGRPIYYSVTDTKIIAYTHSAGTPSSGYVPLSSEYVFIKQIDNVPTIPLSTFTLYQPLDHTAAISSYDGGLNKWYINLPFAFTAYEPTDNDALSSVLTVKVVDDISTLPVSVVLDEDGSKLIATNADATAANPSILSGNGPLHGTAVVNDGSIAGRPAGTITYTPFTDYSGDDTFTYTYTNDDGSPPVNVPVTVTVNPVSDMPIMLATSAVTSEDQPIPLGLAAPGIKDSTDQNAANPGDDSERFGLITLGGIPEGAQLLKSDGTVLFTGTAIDHDVTIRLTDGLYMNGIPVADLNALNTLDFNALKILPPPDSNVNFTVTMSVTEYEVDGSGNQKMVGAALVPGVTKSVNDVITVKAVTDRVDLQWKTTAPDITTDPSHPDSFVTPLPTRTLDPADSYIYTTLEDGTLNKWIAEDSTFNLKSLLEYTAVDPLDTNNSVLGNPAENTRTGDASERRFIVLSNLPVGTVVNGTTIGASGTISIRLTGDKTLPDINITPLHDFSGNIDGIKVTLTTLDTDSSGETGLIVQEEDYVMLNLHVKPVAQYDLTVSNPAKRFEDAKEITFLENVNVTDASTDPANGGVQTITAITVKGIPLGWDVLDPAGNLVTLTGGSFVVTDIAHYKQYTITPPAHSSADATLSLDVITTVDTNADTGSSTWSGTYALTVALDPVAEKFVENSPGAWGPTNTDQWTNSIIPGVIRTGDSDGNGNTADLRMNTHHLYSTPAVEDTLYDLSADGVSFSLAADWFKADGITPFNEDSDETTWALFTPKDSAGNLLYGASFTYAGLAVPLVFNGTAVEIPIAKLATLKFMAPAQYGTAANIVINVSAKTEDTDPDNGNKVTATTGLAVLTIPGVTPVADQVTIAAYSFGGFEDPVAPGIPLYVNPFSDDTDGSQTYNITISDIPVGAVLWYNGSAQPAGSSVTITNFDKTKSLGIVPPYNSDVDIVLKVSGQSQDGIDLSGVTGPLNLLVQVTGVADSATLTTAAPTFVESTVDTTLLHLIPLSSAITGSSMVDGTDGSETLSVRITGLANQFDIEGATYLNGTGVNRVWVVKVADLAGVNIVVPNNYSGTIKFDAGVTPVTTEREGSIWTGTPQVISIKVTPSPESTMTTATTLREDELSQTAPPPKPLSFAIEHHNGDTDETITAVYIKVLDVTAKTFTLYYGIDGLTTLAAAASISAPGVTVESIGAENYYKLTGSAINNIYAQNAPDLHGSGSGYNFAVLYDVQDAPADTTLSSVTVQSPATYTLNFAAVTDPISESIDPVITVTTNATVSGPLNNQVVSATGNTTITVPVPVSQIDQASEGSNGSDTDGSEKLLKFIIDGVPEGVSVKDAIYVGDVYDVAGGNYVNSGRWLLSVNVPFSTQTLNRYVVFFVDGTAHQLAGLHQVVTITAQSQDPGSTTVTAGATFTLEVPVSEAIFVNDGHPIVLPPQISGWSLDTAYMPVEDTPEQLSNILLAPVLTGSGAFSVTLSGLPPGSIVSGTGYTVEQFTDSFGHPAYSVHGSGGDAALQDLLANVTLTTPLNENRNNSPVINLVMTITTSAPGSSNQANAGTNTTTPLFVKPVTDSTTITITAPDALEENSEIFTISFSNSADTTWTTVIGGKLYLKVDESLMLNTGGVLSLVSGGTSMTTLSISGDPLLPDGTYYVISGVTTIAGEVKVQYTPVLNASGSVSVTPYLKTQELNASNALLNSSSAVSFNITPVNDVYNFGVSASGNEDALIPLVLTGTGLFDTDTSEKIVSAQLQHVPDGYLVFYGANAGSAVLALNTGADGSGNTWALPLDADGTLPDFIAVQPPKNVSGDVTGLVFTVYSKEKALGEMMESSRTFTLKVAPKADPVDLAYFKPTKTFGVEGSLIPLNLNLIMNDQDGSETATLTFTGLGEFASFHKADGTLLDATHVTYAAGVYTLTGIPAYDSAGNFDVNKLFVTQSARTGTVTVTAYTVDSASGYSSDTSIGSTQTATFALDISRFVPTTGPDTLLYDGVADLANTRSYDALAGVDTLVLRKGEGIDFATDRSIFNIEKIDLTVSGDHSLLNITYQDVVAMTDPSTHDLYILGDSSNDKAQFLTGNGWSHSTVGGYEEYINSNDSTVKVYVQSVIQNAIV
jgi:hypothetical protein